MVISSISPNVDDNATNDTLKPTTPSQATASYTTAIPIFSEVKLKPSKFPRRFIFTGYFRLQRVSFLHPRSQEVIRLLQQKWEQPPLQTSANPDPNHPPPPPPSSSSSRKRDASLWQKSLNQEWAVLQMIKLTDEELETNGLTTDPQIEVLPDGDRHERGENFNGGNSTPSGRKRRKESAFSKRFLENPENDIED